MPKVHHFHMKKLELHLDKPMTSLKGLNIVKLPKFWSHNISVLLDFLPSFRKKD